jgi:hypothetical protein
MSGRIIAALVALSAALLSPNERRVPVKIDPPQAISAIALRSGDHTVSVGIKNGVALVPSDLPLPWTVNALRFEKSVFTQSDLDGNRPLILRELGRIHGVLRSAKPLEREQRALLLWRTASKTVDEVDFTPDAAGSFTVSMPSGLYYAAVLGELTGTRIRPGIVVDAGQTTDIGELIIEPTTRVSIRVVDEKKRTPVAGAKVSWAPPFALNSEVAASLYARRWSAVTDRRGMAILPSVGPPPIPLRWRIAASAYAPQVTRPIGLRDTRPVSLPDVLLRTEATVVVRTQLPRYDAGELRNARIAVGDQDEANPARFIRNNIDLPLHEGEQKFVSGTYGHKRLWVANASGRRILYVDFDVDSDVTFVNLAPRPIHIAGEVKRTSTAIPRAIVRVADPHEATTVLASATTDDQGRYRITTFQSGRLHLYAIEANRAGVESHAVAQDLDTAGGAEYQMDFDLPAGGASIRVVDAATSKPLRAIVDRRLEYGDGRGEMGMGQTDENGRLALVGYPAGKVHFSVSAALHYTREVDIALADEPSETLIQLDPSKPITGQVVDMRGNPLSGAIVEGGYLTELAQQPSFSTTTDETGHFQFEFAPEPGTIFYVVAARHTLGITTLQPDHENVIAVSSPGRGGVFLMPDHAPPKKLYLVMVAPDGADYIPIGPLYDLAEANGLQSYQLLGTAKDGSVALPEFLPPGSYNLYIALTGGRPVHYQKVGAISLPGDRNRVLTFPAE